MTQESTTSEKLGEKLIAGAVATCGHALYLGYKYLKHGRVNRISIGVLILMAAVTIAGWLYFLHLRGQERAQRRSN